jgi:adenylosuccinate lyase
MTFAVCVQVLSSLSAVAQSLNKMAVDIRLLMNLKEIEEPFERKQIGSSAMAYKRNPMRWCVRAVHLHLPLSLVLTSCGLCIVAGSERICGLARYVVSLTDNAAHTHANQWFERTLDDSSNRRLTLPEAFLATDVILRVACNVVDGLQVGPPPTCFFINPRLIVSDVFDRLCTDAGVAAGHQEAH